MCYVYELQDPRTSEPFYVGKGTKKSRINTHFQPSSLKRKNLKNSKIKNLFSIGLKPRIEIIIDNITEQEAFDIEISSIAMYGRLDLETGILCNHTDDGEGWKGPRPSRRGWSPSPETRRRMSKSRRNSKRAMKSALENVVLMQQSNIGRIRPNQSKFMQTNNPRHLKVVKEIPKLWNHKDGRKFYGNRWKLHCHDPSTTMGELGWVLKGKYKSHRGWY